MSYSVWADWAALKKAWRAYKSRSAGDTTNMLKYARDQDPGELGVAKANFQR